MCWCLLTYDLRKNGHGPIRKVGAAVWLDEVAGNDGSQCVHGGGYGAEEGKRKI